MPRIDVRSIRREQILDAMEPLVAAHGWEHTTFAEICKAAGVSNRVLTYHFKDKDDLLFAVFERAVRRVRENLEPMLPEEMPIEEKLAFIFRDLSAEHKRREFFLLFLHLIEQAAVRPEIAERMRALFQTLRTHLAQSIERAVAEGRISDPDPESTVAIIQCMMLGLMLGRAVLGIEPPPGRVLAMILGFLHDPSACTTVDGIRPHAISCRGQTGDIPA